MTRKIPLDQLPVWRQALACASFVFLTCVFPYLVLWVALNALLWMADVFVGLIAGL